jgi:hypothetical protein
MDDELIDFSCGDWPQIGPHTELVDNGLGPVQWEAPPPTFVWATKKLFGWHSFGNPELGELWYGPWSGPAPDHFLDVLAQIEPFGPTIGTNLVRMKLPARVRSIHEWQLGK